MLYDNSSAEILVILNNAIQYGVLTPLGLADAAEAGKSIYFLLEGNLGPGLGVLIACWFFGKGEEHLRDPPKTCTRPRYHRKSGREIEREVQGMQPTRSFREARSHHPCRRTFVEKRIHQRNAFTG